MSAITKNQSSPSERKYGYVFGCDGLMTYDEACQFLAVSLRKLYELIDEGRVRKGKLTSSKQGSVRLCRRSVVLYAASLEA